MTERELAEILRQGHETPGVEFKGPAPRSNRRLFAKVVRAALAMANRRGGGRIVIGVREEKDRLVHEGLSETDLASWSHDAVSGGMSAYADPYLLISREVVPHHSKLFLVICVEEFEEIPVLCKKGYPDELRDGACYVRRKGRVESSEIPTQAEMRDLLELATEKRVRRLLTMARRVGLDLAASIAPSDAQLYEAELGDFE